ncbi:MAG: UDP-glucose 4-epimerase, partial [Natronomonas sp.]
MTDAIDVQDEQMEHANVLVTGGAGFIGGHIARTLADDNEVAVLDIRPDAPSDAVSRIEGDIRDEDTVEAAVAGADVVFHEAAMVSVDESVAKPKESHDVNATGTLNVLEAARTHDARVVLASSAAVYGDPNETPVPETHPLEPTSPYG